MKKFGMNYSLTSTKQMGRKLGWVRTSPKYFQLIQEANQIVCLDFVQQWAIPLNIHTPPMDDTVFLVSKFEDIHLIMSAFQVFENEVRLWTAITYPLVFGFPVSGKKQFPMDDP